MYFDFEEHHYSLYFEGNAIHLGMFLFAVLDLTYLTNDGLMAYFIAGISRYCSITWNTMSMSMSWRRARSLGKHLLIDVGLFHLEKRSVGMTEHRNALYVLV